MNHPPRLLPLLVLCACGGRTPPTLPPPPAEVGAVVEAEMVTGSVFIATIRSRDSAEIRPQVTGRIITIQVRSGQQVQRGTVLMRIDQSRQRAAVDVAEAASARASADLDRARADLSALRASRKAQATEVDYQSKQLDRIRRLFAADNVSRDEFDRASANLESAQARLAAIDAQIRAQSATIQGLRSSVRQSASQVQEGEAELQYYNVEAGIDGKVGDIPVRVGDLVTPSTLLTTVEGARTRELLVQVPVEHAPQLATDLQVEVRDGRNRLLETLRLDFVAPAVDAVTQTILAKAPISPGSPLTPGQFVRARIIWDRTRGPVVPTSAVLRVNIQPYVFKVQQGQPPTVKQVPVKLGSLQDERYLVERGAEIGDVIVVRGIQRLRDGARITVTSSVATGGR